MLYSFSPPRTSSPLTPPTGATGAVPVPSDMDRSDGDVWCRRRCAGAAIVRLHRRAMPGGLILDFSPVVPVFSCAIIQPCSHICSIGLKLNPEGERTARWEGGGERESGRAGETKAEGDAERQCANPGLQRASQRDVGRIQQPRRFTRPRPRRELHKLILHRDRVAQSCADGTKKPTPGWLDKPACEM